MPTSPPPITSRRASLLPRSRRALLALGIGLVASVGAIAAVSVANAASTVVVDVDGDQHDVRVRGGTVADALDALDIDLGTADELSPAAETPVEGDLDVEVVRAITVDVEVHGSVARRVTAPLASVGDVLAAADMGDLAAEGARIEPARHEAVSDGDVIAVSLPVAVTVAVDGEELETDTFAPDIPTVLEEVGVELGPEDRVLPAADGLLLGPSTLTVQRVEVKEETEDVVLDHDEVHRETSDLERGSTRVDQEGRDGLRVDTYEVTLVEGDEEARERVSQEVVREPRDRVVLVGTKPPPEPAPATSSSGSSGGSSSSGVWDRLARCESGGNWSINTGNGYYGGLQFNPQTWRSVGGSGLPHQASKAEQIRRGEILQARSGWGQWPACSRKLGLR